MELVLKDINSKVSVANKVFGSSFNEALVHQIITSYRSFSRQGSCAQKNRSAVSGSGKKPWKQKGTGRARSGSIRSPIWRSGGVAFASRPRTYKVKVNKKMYRGALRSILSKLIRDDRMIPVSSFSLDFPKTKILIEKLKREIGFVNDVLILIDNMDRNLFLASRNLHKVKICNVSNINPYILISFSKIVITIQSIKKLEGILI